MEQPDDGSKEPVLLVLRALKLGDMLVAVPALRALRRAYPRHRLLYAAQGWLAEALELVGGYELLPTHGLDVPIPIEAGTVDVAVGVSGLKAIKDERGMTDPYGYRLKAAVAAVADEIAAAAELVMGKRSGIPVVIVRGCEIEKEKGSVKELLRPETEDLFRHF